MTQGSLRHTTAQPVLGVRNGSAIRPEVADMMTRDPSDTAPRVALMAVELGRMQRGFERFFSGLFESVRDKIDITLYQGGGTSDARRRIPGMLGVTTALARKLPLGSHTGGSFYKGDCMAFGICVLPELLRQRYDVIHCIDPPLAKMLVRFRTNCGLRSRLIFTEGCAAPIEHYPKVDHIHQVAEVAFRNAIRAGVPESHMTMIPLGMHTGRFNSTATRQELRAKHGISEATLVILAISALDRVHKRVDYIIEETSQLQGDFLLWIDGHLIDPTLPELARQKLGSKCRVTHVPTEDIPELYRLADIMVHASLDEAFGLAMVEAVCSGLRVITHNSPHFEWLLQSREWAVDMRVPGNLAARLQLAAAQSKEGSLPPPAAAESVGRRFDWATLAPEYVAMYHKVSGFKTTAAGAELRKDNRAVTILDE